MLRKVRITSVDQKVKELLTYWKKKSESFWVVLLNLS